MVSLSQPGGPTYWSLHRASDAHTGVADGSHRWLGRNRPSRAALQQLSPQLERHGAAGAEAGDDARAAGLERPDLLREVRREVLDAREWLAPAVEPGRLEPEEGLVVAQVLRQRAVAEYVAVVPRHREYGRARAASLERHDRARPLRQRFGRPQEFQDLALAALQLVAPLRRESTGRGRAPQAPALGPGRAIAGA